jgi:hypothetical protein
MYIPHKNLLFGGPEFSMTEIRPSATTARAADMTRRSFTEGLQLKTNAIRCAMCGAVARPLEIELIGIGDAPSEIIDVSSWIQCPRCGPLKQATLAELETRATIDYIPAITATNS